MSMVKLKAEDVVVRLGGTLVVDGATFDRIRRASAWTCCNG